MLYDISSIYEGTVWRPPSEARSLILQATVGCSWNRCTFCIAYIDKEFRIKTLKEIEADIEYVLPHYRDTRRIFLADGNALCIPTADLLRILGLLRERFPRLERVSIYGGPNDIIEKSIDELRSLNEAGLGIIYLGLESGSDEVLRMVRKGADSRRMVDAGKRVRSSGTSLSAIVIQGLGGKGLTHEHATGTARVLSEMDPAYIGALSLMVCEGTQMRKDVEEGKTTLLSPKELLRELKVLVGGLQLSNCIFRANHPSNYVTFKGTFPKDKKRLLDEIDRASLFDEGDFRPEWLRGL
jgi:radical SAM superfamily enzyme YgiQ (UPF0313 family)